ncbi:DUF1236 domain-containing protein [Aurantimonas marianensis]|uniref:DUF1236 domain-containing protein n=1 Tax=Aurantimonas marianensis TaxID=2920428 RepID=A0A9X2KDZ8_9HYPH|nr:DUF1236 domain-containing protein [Aurantimonas marianensis]MCP3053921.1 DUF1236 domain-containing protein [Aurantimonas marianensis]
MLRTALIVALSTFALTMAASAQGADEKVIVLQYAADNPSDNAQLPTVPQLGDSVPDTVALQQVPGNSNLVYFYYDGEPVLVDLKTRSIVRIGQ